MCLGILLTDWLGFVSPGSENERTRIRNECSLNSIDKGIGRQHIDIDGDGPFLKDLFQVSITHFVFHIHIYSVS